MIRSFGGFHHFDRLVVMRIEGFALRRDGVHRKLGQRSLQLLVNQLHSPRKFRGARAFSNPACPPPSRSSSESRSAFNFCNSDSGPDDSPLTAVCPALSAPSPDAGSSCSKSSVAFSTSDLPFPLPINNYDYSDSFRILSKR